MCCLFNFLLYFYYFQIFCVIPSAYLLSISMHFMDTFFLLGLDDA